MYVIELHYGWEKFIQFEFEHDWQMQLFKNTVLPPLKTFYKPSKASDYAELKVSVLWKEN